MRDLIYKFGYFIFLKSDYPLLFKEYNFLKENQFKTIQNNLSLQKQRLYSILNFAIKKIPYYNKIAEDQNIKISKPTIFKDIKKFPVLTKDIIRENFDSLHPIKMNFKYVLETSGGTTGEPIKILQDWGYRIRAESATLFVNRIAGYNIGEKLLWLWGSERDIIRDTKGIFNSLKNRYIKNHYFLNAFRMSDSIINQYIKEINRIRPKIILAYVQSINEMAKYIKRKNLKIYKPYSIIVSAGVLTDEVREFIESIFHCRVYNRYASREIGIISSSCKKSNKLHINMGQQYIEILDDTENVLEKEERGNIIITNMINYGMPLIRYKIGDRGSISTSQCTCGRGLYQLNNVFGRVVDIFKNDKGELIDGEYFTHLFYFQEKVKQFQVVQKKIDHIDVNLVITNKSRLQDDEEKDLIEKILIVMGNNCSVKFNYLDYIDPSSSGKFRYTISKI